MPQFDNIGLYYQKYYFKDIVFDNQDLYKKGKAAEIKDRNRLLLEIKENSLDNTLLFNDIVNDHNRITLESVYPGMITGIGMKHETGIEGELKLGMYFDYSSGMPSIPGASVKGAIRSAFPQFGNHKKTDIEIKIAKCFLINEIVTEIIKKPFISINKLPYECSQSDFKEIIDLENEIFEGYTCDDSGIKKFLSVYERDIFHDAFISKGDSSGRILGDDAITNHPSPLSSPNPVMFLKLISGVKIQFNYDLKNGKFLNAIQKKELFKKILLRFGVGAKTNVGYGQLKELEG